MIPSLPLFHRVAGQPVLVLGTGAAAEAKRRLVERAGGVPTDDLQRAASEGARLAFVAHDDPGEGEAAAVRARCAGLLVNVADRPELCDFTVPSILDRAPVLIAVGTGGTSAGLAKALRLRLEALLPAGLGKLAEALHAIRETMRGRWPDAADRRRALDAALAEGGPLDPLRTDAGEVAEWLDRAAAPPITIVAEIRLRSADPDDLSLREARLLGTADLLYIEPAVPGTILARARADAARRLIAPGEMPSETSRATVILRA